MTEDILETFLQRCCKLSILYIRVNEIKCCRSKNMRFIDQNNMLDDSDL